mgnify:FL=1
MPPNSEADPRLDAFREASMEFDAVYNLLAKSCGLSDPEFWSLVLIQEGVRTQREISEQLSISRQTLNSAFKLLVRKGLICLTPLERDQRSKQAVLTHQGERFVEERILPALSLEEQAWSFLSVKEQEMLTQLTHKFSTALLQLLHDSTQFNADSSEDL